MIRSHLGEKFIILPESSFNSLNSFPINSFENHLLQIVLFINSIGYGKVFYGKWHVVKAVSKIKSLT